MNAPHRSQSLLIVVLLIACREPESPEPYVPSVCSEEMLTRSVIAMRNADGTITLREDGVCGLECDCAEGGTDCNWEILGIEAAPGLYEDLQTKCVECYGTVGGEVLTENTGTLELVRVDADGVTGCAVDTCVADFRFEVTWCPE